MEKYQRIAAYGIILDSGNILLCRLSERVPKWQGYWTLPGGGLEFGESPEEAMVREVEEETGLIVAPAGIAMISNIHDKRETREFHGIRIIYRVRVTGGDLKNEKDGTTDQCAWHAFPPPEDIKLVDLSEEVIGFLSGNLRC